MRLIVAVISALLWSGLLMAPALAANVEDVTDLSEQRMHVALDGRGIHSWPVSTARPGYITPIGRYRPVPINERSVWAGRGEGAGEDRRGLHPSEE